MTFKNTASFSLILLILITLNAYPQRTKSSLSAGNQRHSEKSLKDNSYFFKFINTTISNSGTEQEKKIFIEAAKRDLISRMLYMKFSFNPAMHEINKTQLLLIDLFSIIAVRENEAAKALLNEIAPEILKTKNKLPQKYMALGYRSADMAEKIKIMSDNLPENNYSIKLYEYVKAIKNAKYCKRYAIIALIENRLPDEKKGRINYNKFDTVKKLIDQYLPESKEKFIKIHTDNFYRIENAVSIYDGVISNPELETIPEYKDYIKEN